jgi:ribonucleases P/MRP protein subunit RPP40
VQTEFFIIKTLRCTDTISAKYSSLNNPIDNTCNLEQGEEVNLNDVNKSLAKPIKNQLEVSLGHNELSIKTNKVNKIVNYKSSERVDEKGVTKKQNKVLQVNKISELKCIYFNARSIINKLSELELLINSEQPDIIGITETWANENISDDELSFEGYSLFRKDRNDPAKKRGGGIAMYIKSCFNPTDKPISCKSDSLEISFCSINCDGEKTNIGICYRPPGIISIQDEALFEVMGGFKNETFILMGDFNFPELNFGDSYNLDSSHGFVKSLENNFLFQMVDKPTRNNNYLDLVISTDESLIRNLSVDEPFESSDHQMIRFSLLCKAMSKCKNNKFYEYFKTNYNKIRDHVKTLGWDALQLSNDVNEIWSKIKADLLEVRNKFIKVRGKKKKRSKWITKKVDKVRLRKKQAWIDYNNAGRPEALYREYKTQLNLSVKTNKKAKRKFEHNLADKIKSDSKSFYSYVNSKSRANKKVGPIRGESAELIDNNSQAAEHLNKYFCTVFTQENLQTLPNPVTFFQNSYEESLLKLTISEHQVLHKLGKINVNKSVGPDEIHPKLIFELRNYLAAPISQLFNLSIVKGDIPQDWKDANISPIFKKGSRDQAQNYRPVSLTSIIGKLLEGFIKEALVGHLDKFQLLKDSQHGFRSGRSCLTNLLEFFDVVTKKLDEEEDIDLIYLDFAKAFDKVPYQRLLSKLESHGVRGDILKWIQNWLSGRNQRVCIDGQFSEWAGVTSGVPQGSVLGPILFLVYINDLDIDLISKIGKFADDSKLLGSVGTVEGVENLRKDLKNLEIWAEKWQMQFNVNKCSVIHLGKNNPQSTFSLYNEEIKNSIKERDLGVIIDKTMKFSEQCNIAAKNANMTLGMIKRNIVSRNKNIIIKLYKALVRPKLEYCIQAWRPYLKKDIDKLEKVQRRATKIITECKGLSYQERLKVTGLTTLEKRRDRGDMIEVFKSVKGLNSVDYRKFFEPSDNRHTTRGHSFKLVKVRSRLESRRNFFSTRVVSAWNSLPQNIVDASSVNSFKNRYDKHYK